MRIAVGVVAAMVFGVFIATATATDHAVVSSIETDLSYDENGKLTSHYLLYPADSACSAVSTFSTPTGFQTRAVTEEALQPLFLGLSEKNDCRAVCIERGVDRSVAGAVMPHKRFDDSSSGSFATWFEHTCAKAEVCLMNYHKETPVKLYWMNPKGEKKFQADIGYGERNTLCFSSFIGHKFQAEDGETGQVLGSFTIEYTLVVAFGESPASGDASRHSFDQEIERTLHNEWTRHNRVTRTFSPLGFKKGRLPPDVFASMGAFYYNNRWNKVREEWGGKGVFVNWWETDCSFIQIPWELKGLWQSRLKELVEAWAGVPIEQTALYGLRQYESGARLLTHVDIHTTHAVSLIVNVAQGNLTEPWPVEVQDHADRLHEVIMEPGDIVYYESAKCLHGRNRPMAGPNAYYVNLFTHYRPIGDDNWYVKENHEGTPEPVMQVEGECRLKQVGTTETVNNQLGIVKEVQCDDKRLGPYISPSLFTATGGEDLIDWRRMTGPNPVIERNHQGGDNERDEM